MLVYFPRPDDWLAAARRQARAYNALQPILTAAMQQHDQLESQLATVCSDPNARPAVRATPGMPLG